ncbi:MAG: ABC transporter permease [Acidobacteriota bacterium]|nr:ABC transporter permease [Acidobacteriota bacterium]
MIFSIVRTGWMALRRDRGALALSFVLPIAFFSIFAVIFGGQKQSTPKISVIVADEDHSSVSARLLKGLQAESSLNVLLTPLAKKNQPVPYTAATAEAAVREGVAPVALVVPKGFGEHPINIGDTSEGQQLRLLKDSSDPVAPQMLNGLLQKVAMTSLTDLMAEQGMKYWDSEAGGFTAQQKERMEAGLRDLRDYRARQERGEAKTSAENDAGLIRVQARDVVGANKQSPLISFYAAAIGVMFLLFTSSGAAGSLLDEAENGTLDRVLSSQVDMTTLLLGKLTYSTLLAFSQLTLMFVWAWSVFHVDLWSHIPGFLVMGLSTALAVGAFGLMMASFCRTRAQLGAVSTLLILLMSSIGGSMFPRYLMPEAVQKAGLLTLNAWAIDGFTKVFWRDEPLVHLAPQVGVLLAAALILFLLARRLARRWEFA